MIVLHTLGDALILVGEKNVRPSSPLVFASLLYLAMERGRRVPRAALQELLFPDSDERSGAHSLRQLLYKLRQLGVPLESDATTVMVRADRVRDATSVDGATHAATVSLLPDYEPDISVRFSEWLDLKRAEAAKELRARLASAIETHRESLNWSAVERDAQALLSIDPFNEVGTFALAEAAALSGRKAAALKILSDYERETGRTDLRLPASLLRRRILQAVPEPVATLSPLPFVGRDAEVKELRKYIARARGGQPWMYVIGGEAGIGKTRLLTETAALAALEGVSVFTVRCQSHYASRPLSVFIELVPALRAARGALGISPQSLASLNSLTSHTDEQSERPPDSRDDITRSELLLSAIRDLVDAVASECPLFLAVEDAHWADHDSLREMNRLIQTGRARPLFIVCTTRTPESFPFSAITDDRSIARRLKPLSAETMGRLAQHLLGKRSEAPTTELVGWTVRSAGGNPLFLQMLCSHYTATGSAFSVPADVLAAVTRRVEHLPESARRLLAVCALLGNHSSVNSLKALTNWNHLQLFDSIHRLEEDGYIVLANGAIRITHDLVVQAVLSLIPPISRRVLHAAVAAALEARFDVTNDAALLWDCTEQWVLSGDTRKALEFLIRCARHATRFGKAAEALKLLSRAELIARDRGEVLEVTRERVTASVAAGQWREVCEAAERLSSLDDPVVNEHSLYEIIALDAHWRHRFEGKRSIGRLCHCISDQSSSNEHRVDAAYLLLTIAHELGDGTLAERVRDATLHLLNGTSASHKARLLPALYETCFGDVQEGVRLCHQLLRGLSELQLLDEFRSALSLAASLGMAGDREALALSEEYFNKAQARGLLSWQADFALSACTIHILAEEFDSASEWHRAAADLNASFGTLAARMRSLGNELELAIGKADCARARACLKQIDASFLGDSLRGRSYFLSATIRTAQLESGFDVDDSTLDELRSLHRATKSLFCADGLTLALGEALLRRGLTVEAAQTLHQYVCSERREVSPLPPTLRSLVQRTTHSEPARVLMPATPAAV